VNLPNQITVARLLLAVVLFVLLEVVCRGSSGAVWYLAFVVYLVTVLSDGLDGYLARSRGQVTAFGRIADPLADKIVICGVLVLAMDIPETAQLVPAWIVLLVLAREFLVSGMRGYLEGRGAVFGARWEGKTKLVVQAFYCGTVIFYPGDRFEWVRVVGEVALWATALITAYSAVGYVRRARNVILGAGSADI
jgi:CDP-diacylglycerol--glycerol-3-phosphate 3-phosphatidyltransferase